MPKRPPKTTHISSDAFRGIVLRCPRLKKRVQVARGKMYIYPTIDDHCVASIDCTCGETHELNMED